jgi:AcrR family transcriptional regulator
MTDTPTRILEAAWALVRERESVDVTVAEIAAAAGVSRQLVYFHFDNRAGLLTAMARHHDESSGFVDAVAASRAMPPAEGLEHLLRAWCEYMPTIVPVARALEAALVTGDDGGSAWRQRMGELRAAVRMAVARVELAPGWTVESAADWAWSRIQPTTWQHLVGERGWTAEEYRERTVRSLLAELLAGVDVPPS